MTVNLHFANLEPHVQDKFYAVAAKDPNGASAVEWFEHLVPEPLQDSSAETEVFMDGGTVTQDVWVYDQGRGSGHWETVEHEIGDRDISRMEAGVNGGEYTHDNTIMEDSSLNRARGGEDMTATELEAAEAAEAADVALIDGSTEATETLTSVATDSTEIMTDVIGGAVDVAIAGVAAYKVGEAVYNNCPDDWSEDQKVLATGGSAIGTGLLAFTPPGQVVIGLYATYKLLGLGYKLVRKFA